MENEIKENNGIYRQNRELSWLRFDERCLDEATDESVPLLERLSFVSIFSSNLDEFFMIRVGSLHDISLSKKQFTDNKTGMTASEQLSAIFDTVRPLMIKKDNIYEQISHGLRARGIQALKYEELSKADIKQLSLIYRGRIEPILSPQIVDAKHPFPHLSNKVIHIGAFLRGKKSEKPDMFGIIPVPASVPEIIFLPGDDTIRYVFTADVIAQEAKNLFAGYHIAEQTVFCVTRNADISLDEDAYDQEVDYRSKMKKLLKQRPRLCPVRLEISSQISPKFSKYLCARLGITQKQIFVSSSPMKISYIGLITQKLSEEQKKQLLYDPFQPCTPQCTDMGGSIIKQAQSRNLFFSYPYESMDAFLKLLKEAANDPGVVSIKITIYRLASRAKIVDYLCAAAENGKDVTVMIELRARFDEQNNIDWSQHLEDAGCHILYGIGEYKVHSKLCLITLQDKNGAFSTITQIGTGNYNEKTATLYSDFSYVTSDPAIGRDANDFFKNLSLGTMEGEYEKLLVAPRSMKQKIMAYIDEEISKGSDGSVLIKVNSVTDLELIEKLRDASRAGVQVQMIVRGICCLLPGVAGETDNITVRSIVGRYLEHARVYVFGKGKDEKMYISSADFMTRNMDRRIEVACPIEDADARRRIHRLLDLQLQDNMKSRVLLSNGTLRSSEVGQQKICAQEQLMEDALQANPVTVREKKPSFFQRLLSAFRKKKV